MPTLSGGAPEFDFRGVGGEAVPLYPRGGKTPENRILVGGVSADTGLGGYELGVELRRKDAGRGFTPGLNRAGIILIISVNAVDKVG